MLAALPSWVADLTAVCAAIVGIGAVIGLLLRAHRAGVNRFTDEVRDVIRAEVPTMVQRETEPLHASVHEVYGHVVVMAQLVGYQLTPNGGDSLVDRAKRAAESTARIEQAINPSDDT